MKKLIVLGVLMLVHTSTLPVVIQLPAQTNAQEKEQIEMVACHHAQLAAVTPSNKHFCVVAFIAQNNQKMSSYKKKPFEKPEAKVLHGYYNAENETNGLMRFQEDQDSKTSTPCTSVGTADGKLEFFVPKEKAKTLETLKDAQKKLLDKLYELSIKKKTTPAKDCQETLLDILYTPVMHLTATLLGTKDTTINKEKLNEEQQTVFKTLSADMQKNLKNAYAEKIIF